MDLETLDDGCIRCCLTENGFTSCTIVSSHHLIESKRKYLHDSNLRKAMESFGDTGVTLP